MKKIFAFVVAALAFVSCNMDFYSSDSMTSSQLKDNPSSAVYTTDGVYALFKDALAYKGQSGPEDGNQYLRHYFQLTELRGDNVVVSGQTEDPFLNPYCYQDIPTEKNIYYTWWIGYKIIYATNSNISSIVPGASESTDILLGENYFLRALVHFQLVTLFARPYICGTGNPGIILHQGMESYSNTIARATVGQVYDAVVEDLKTSISYLDGKTPRGDHSYASAEAAKALLARVYLYMERNQECLDLCNELLATAPSEATAGYDFAAYPTHTYDSPETIFCIKMSTIDSFFADSPTASISSMYLKSTEKSQGWGEHYWNDELIDIFQRYPGDRRFEAYYHLPEGVLTNDGVMVCFAIKAKENSTNCSTYTAQGPQTTGADGKKYNSGLTPNADGSVDFTYDGKNYKAVPTIVNTYTEYYVNGIDFVTGQTGSSEKSRVFVRPNVNKNGFRSNGGNYVITYNTKFAGQDGEPMLTSPVFLRWGEVILNRAEAQAKLSNDQAALDDVNTIRKRAGLSGDALMTTSNYKERGYETVLDVVLAERRLELCFEGHRNFDLFRNRKQMDRRYVGFHPYEIIDWNDIRLALLIPLDEINSSHIEQNPR